MLDSLVILQRIGQFIVFTSDFTPEDPGTGRKNNSLQHPSAQFAALPDV
jgi:hypothetical protein